MTRTAGDDRPRSGTQEAGPSFVAAALRYWWMLVLGLAAGVGAGYGLSEMQDELYEAGADLFLVDPRSVGVFGETPEVRDQARYLANRAERMTSRPFLERAAEVMDGQRSAGEIGDRVDVRVAPDVDLIIITATDPSPEVAATIVNSLAQAYEEIIAEEAEDQAQRAITQLEGTAAQLRTRIMTAVAQLEEDPENAAALAERDAAISQLVSVEGRADQIAVDATLFGSGVEAFEPALPPRTPTQPRPRQNMAAGGLLGLILAASIAWWWAGRERQEFVDAPHDAQAVLGAPLLGEIPDFGAVTSVNDLPVVNAPRSPATEAYHFIVESLVFAMEGLPGHTVVLTSPRQGDGKTVTALGLAISAARDTRQVILVDGDDRMRGLSRLSGVTAKVALPDLQHESVPVEWALAAYEAADGTKVPLIPSAPEEQHTPGFFRTPGFRLALQRLQARSDLLFIDAPPLLAVAEASAIAGQSDGIVLVVARGTPVDLLEETRARLEFVGTPLLGYIFNRADPSTSRYQYGPYGYGEEPAPNGGSRRRVRRRAKSADTVD